MPTEGGGGLVTLFSEVPFWTPLYATLEKGRGSKVGYVWTLFYLVQI